MQRVAKQRYIPALIDLNDLGGPKMVREMLNVLGISERSRGISRSHLERLRKLAYLCENHRPVDARSFTHDDLHTPTCGCDKEQYLNEDQDGYDPSRQPEVIAFYTNEDLLHRAWTIIANVSEGNWEDQTEEWQNAAARWRNEFHDSLKD